MTDPLHDRVGRGPVVVRPFGLVLGACLVVVGITTMIDTWVDGHVDWSRALPLLVLVAGVSLAGLTVASWRRRT